MITARYCGIDDVKAVIYDDEIYERITDDSCPPKEEFELPEYGYRYIGGYINGKIASLFIIHDKKMHFMVLKQYRKYSRELFKASREIYPHYVYVAIPMLYPEVINFAKKSGFKEKDIVERSFLKNGRLYDIHILEV